LVFDREWELIIVDNGSVDKTGSIVSEFTRAFSVPVIYLFEAKPGLGNAHNAALSIARGDILAFTDDDCYPAANFLEQVWAAFVNPSLGYIAGRITLYDPADYPVTVALSTRPRAFPAGSFLRGGAVQGANMAFRRRVLLDVGGFDPLFGPGSQFNAEDIDVASRASARGWNGEYRPEVVVQHHHGRKETDVPALERSYAMGRGAYQMKLLLNQRRFWWSARRVYELCWCTISGDPRAPFWETVGAIKYAYLHFARGSRTRVSHKGPLSPPSP
jgi:cellulose synthase/poly-beta-1,6-N-acetylglucosamine synthase-like glycosyltransferase